MNTISIELNVNGRDWQLSVAPNEMLLNVLRERLHYTGTKYGCGIGECSACTVLMDDTPVLSCQILAVQCVGKKIVTIEGLAEGQESHPMQDAFIEEGAVQCGFCTPAMVLTAAALVKEKPDPENQDIRDALRGNFCRCTGYVKILKAVQSGARKMRELS